MGEPEEHERNGAVPIFRGILDTAARWKADGASAEEAAAELAAVRSGPATFEEAPAAFAYALLAMDPAVLEGAVDRSTLADTDTTSPVAVPVFILAADETVLTAFPARHAERLAQTHPDVEVVRVPGARHGIHDEIEHRAVYVEHVARFLATHADGG